MRTLYLDCGMGAAGDMLTAALLELMPDPEGFVKELNGLEIPDVHFEREQVAKCGIIGTHMKVTVHGVEEGEHMHDHGHDHTHDHEHAHDDHSHEHTHSHDHEHAHDEHCLDHAHTHDHEHAHDDHSHEHTHSHDHEHTHDDHSHEHTHTHHHTSMHDIEHIVREHMKLPQKVQEDVLAVYTLIAEAESHAHGRPVTEIHFHEVGTMDAIADVTAVCLLMDRLSPGEVVVSPIHVGSGQVKCTHGILPVPAPATAFILRDVPIYGGEVRGELCTPTGAALLKHFATRFGSMPMMKVQGIGYGMGKKDFERANCVRAMLGETIGTARAADSVSGRMEGTVSAADSVSGRMEGTVSAADSVSGRMEGTMSATNYVAGGAEGSGDEVCELCCNVDDMTGEDIGYAMERLFEAGAKDVFNIPIGMKKSRPGILLSVLCAKADREKMIQTMFQHTTTIGIRETVVKRYVLDRRVETMETPYGRVHYKISEGYGVKRCKPEYEDLAKISGEMGMSLEELRSKLEGLK